MEATFLIVDPFHEYALRFIDVVRARFGVDPLCVITEGRVARKLREFPRLRERERVQVPFPKLREYARQLRSQREVLGVIPFNEQVLGPCIELLIGLGSTWNEERVLAILRDKFGLKQWLRDKRPDLKVGISRRIPAGEGRRVGEAGLERFVLKPNTGFGNQNVGYFSCRTPPEVIEEFMRSCADTELVLEEYLPGPEYFVNAQVDHQGGCLTQAIFTYRRVWANGRQVDWLTRKVARVSPEFDLLATYVQSVVGAVGLRRSPIHLEVKLAGGVPRLIELGARLAGNRNAFLCNRLHANRLDVFAVAADHYLREGAVSPPQLDWRAYDATEVLYVHGVSFERGYIHRLEGIDALEQHPFFAGWVKKPEVGQRLWPTIDLFTAPFCFLLETDAGKADLGEVAQQLRETLRINEPGDPLRKASVTVAGLLRRVRNRLERLTDFR